MPASVSQSWIDNSGEKGTVRFYLPDITSVNYDAITGNGVGQSVGDLRLAVAAITLCNHVRSTVTAEQYNDAPTLPADAFAQREIKLQVKYADTVTAKVYRVEIPGPDLDLIAQTGTDIVDHTSNAAAIALTTAIEANAVSPDGNAVTVQQMRIVGRSN